MTDEVDDLKTRVAEMIAARDRGREKQPKLLDMARAAAEAARARAIEDEPWSDCVSAVPMTDAESGELAGMFSVPGVDARVLWGTRLAFDALDTGGDRDRYTAVLERYMTALHGNTEHLFFVFNEALRTIAEFVMPAILESLERHQEYHHRVNLADAARNAWATRASDHDET